MKLFNSKWISLFLSLVCVGCKTVHTEIIIPVEPEVIWSVLMDETSYKNWHSVLVPLEGEKIKEGNKLKYTMTGKNGKKIEINLTVIEIVKERKLNQYGGLWGVMTFNHTYLLEPVDEGTRLIQHEEFRGIFIPFWDASWLEPAYQRSNEALRDRVVHQKKRAQRIK